ncbi:MAG: hypothetical protein U0519_00485 [Candidatus Gracilibacteria bacterium]
MATFGGGIGALLNSNDIAIKLVSAAGNKAHAADAVSTQQKKGIPDTDSDGLNNMEEIILKTAYKNPDTNANKSKELRRRSP